jgi:hypothetical protein
MARNPKVAKVVAEKATVAKGQTVGRKITLLALVILFNLLDIRTIYQERSAFATILNLLLDTL